MSKKVIELFPKDEMQGWLDKGNEMWNGMTDEQKAAILGFIMAIVIEDISESFKTGKAGPLFNEVKKELIACGVDTEKIFPR